MSQPATALPYWRLSGFYLCFFAALGSVLPYWPLFLSDLGYDAYAIGLLTGVGAATRIVSPNVWGWITDRSRHPLGVVRWATFCALLSFAAVLWRQDFTALLIITASYTFFWNGALPVFETVTLRHLHGQTPRYSRIRLWGSIGFIAAVFSVGHALDVYPTTLVPYLVATGLAGLWLSSLLVPAVSAAPRSIATSGYGALLKRREVLAFLGASLLLQLAHGAYYTFFTVYLKEHGYSSGQAGQFWCLGVVAEVLLFIGMARWQHYLSLRRWLLLGLAASTLRWGVLPWVVDYAWALAAIQTLHALTFGASHIAAINLIQHYFVGHVGKGQGLYNSVSYGVGGLLGSYLSGLLWNDWGGATVFQGAAAVSGLAFVLTWWGVRHGQD